MSIPQFIAHFIKNVSISPSIFLIPNIEKNTHKIHLIGSHTPKPIPIIPPPSIPPGAAIIIGGSNSAKALLFFSNSFSILSEQLNNFFIFSSIVAAYIALPFISPEVLHQNNLANIFVQKGKFSLMIHIASFANLSDQLSNCAFSV